MSTSDHDLASWRICSAHTSLCGVEATCAPHDQPEPVCTHPQDFAPAGELNWEPCVDAQTAPTMLECTLYAIRQGVDTCWLPEVRIYVTDTLAVLLECDSSKPAVCDDVLPGDWWNEFKCAHGAPVVGDVPEDVCVEAENAGDAGCCAALPLWVYPGQGIVFRMRVVRPEDKPADGWSGGAAVIGMHAPQGAFLLEAYRFAEHAHNHRDLRVSDAPPRSYGRANTGYFQGHVVLVAHALAQLIGCADYRGVVRDYWLHYLDPTTLRYLPPTPDELVKPTGLAQQQEAITSRPGWRALSSLSHELHTSMELLGFVDGRSHGLRTGIGALEVDHLYCVGMAAAYLHDVVEDTHVPLGEIHERFGARVGELVDVLTDLGGRNRVERHKRSYPRIGEHSDLAVLIKLCDRLVNVATCYNTCDERIFMYAREHYTFVNTLLLSGRPVGQFAVWPPIHWALVRLCHIFHLWNTRASNLTRVARRYSDDAAFHIKLKTMPDCVLRPIADHLLGEMYAPLYMVKLHV